MSEALARLDAYLQSPLDRIDEFDHSDECEENEVERFNCGCIVCPDERCDIYLACKGCHKADMAGL